MANATTRGPGDVDGLRVETVADGQVLRVALHGECDFSKVSYLEQTLQGLEFDGSRLVFLDLTHLAFADVATIRRLAAFAGHAKRAGKDVATGGAHPTLRKVADLLQVHGELGLH
jgi:anti-anti-sigma regulatory factor